MSTVSNSFLTPILQNQVYFSDKYVAIINAGLDTMKSSLTAALFISNDPPTHPPLLQPKSKVYTGRKGRPRADINPTILGLLTQTHRSAARIADLFGTHPRTVTRHQQCAGFKEAGQAPFQTVVDANGHEHTIHTPTRPKMSDIDDEELDKLIDGILGRCPGYGRGQIKDALDRLGHRVCRQRIAAAKKRVNGPNLTFGQRLLARKNYDVPGANSMWHHDGNHHELHFWFTAKGR